MVEARRFQQSAPARENCISRAAARPRYQESKLYESSNYHFRHVLGFALLSSVAAISGPGAGSLKEWNQFQPAKHEFVWTDSVFT